MTTKKRILLKIVVLLFALFVVNSSAMKFHWYDVLWWFDMPMHFLGGFISALLVLYIYQFKKTTLHDIVHPKHLFVVSVAGVLLIGVLWELFEFGLETFGTIDLARPIDSVSDLFFDSAGGILGTLYYIHSFRRIIKEVYKV